MTVFEMNNIIEDALNGSPDQYAIYLRKSRADLEAEKLGQGETLARHRRILTELAARKGLFVAKIFEEVVSGDTIQARPQIQKLIEECYQGKYRGIIIMATDRLSRGNYGDAQTIMDCLKYSNRNRGLLVITPTKVYDVASNHDDEEYMEFELFMSRKEFNMIRRRLANGKIQAVVEGNYMGAKRIFGYNISEGRKTRILVPHPEEAPIVKMIFEWASNGVNPCQIATRLENMGVPTINGGEWAHETVRTMLKNVHYIGRVKWFDHVKVKVMEDGKLVTKMERKTDKYMEFEGKHEALIDEETFKLVNSRFKSDKTKSGRPLKNPLAGLLVCGKCGKALRWKEYVRSEPRYLHESVKRCKIRSASASDVMDAFTEALKLQIEDFEASIDNKPIVSESSVETQTKALQAELKKIKQKKMKLFDEWDELGITANEFAERKTYLNDKADAIQRQLNELETLIPDQTEIQEKTIMLHQAIDMLKDDSIDVRAKNEFLKGFISKIEYSRENDYEFILDVFLA